MTTTQTERLGVAPENARKFAEWIASRNGLLVWKSADFGSLGRSVTTPAKTADGADTPSPGWRFPKPDRHITSIDEVEVYKTKVVDSFPVGFKRSGMQIVLNNRSDRKVRTRLANHPDSWYRFASTGSSVGSLGQALTMGEDVVEICIEDGVMPLRQWLEENA